MLRPERSLRLGGGHLWLWPLISCLATTQNSLATTHNTPCIVCFQHHSLASKKFFKIWFRFEMFWVCWQSSPDTSLDREWLMFVLFGCFSWLQVARRPRPEWVLEIGWCPSRRPMQRRWPTWRHRTRSEPQPTPSHSLWAGTYTRTFTHCLASVSFSFSST